MVLPEPDEQSFEPKVQTESGWDGPGQPPRRTAIGLTDSGAEPEALAPLKWWQKVLAKSLMFLLGVNQKTEDD